MLTEEALIVLAALAALGALALGVWELISPARPRQRSAAPSVSVAPRHSRRSSRPRHAVRRAGHWGEPWVVTPLAGPRVADVPASALQSTPDPTPSGAVAADAGREPAPEARAAGVADAQPTAIVEECRALYQAQRFDAVIAKAVGALAAAPVAGGATEGEAAALWSVVALACQSLGDEPGARDALEHAIETAPAAERATYERQLAALSLSVAQAALARASAPATGDSEARVATIREALTCLERGMEAAPDDAVVRDLVTTARTMLWPAYEQVALGLVQRQQFRAARALLREALADPAVPEARAATYRELISGTYGGEVGQLTAQALRSMQSARECEALTALGRAGELLETIRDSPLPPPRREEVDRRLWWGYKKLGLRRLEAGDYDAAIEPFTAALRFADGSPERIAETRAALLRAYEGIAASRVLAIRNVAEAGDREAAVGQADQVWRLLRQAAAWGLTEADLSSAFAPVRRLLQELGRARQ